MIQQRPVRLCFGFFHAPISDESEAAMTLELTVNGAPQSIDQPTTGATLVQVLESLGHNPSLVVVEHNGLIAPRSRWQEPMINPGDNLEIVTIVGGGS